MISHQHRLIFIHIPKTAGSSVELALGHYERGEVGHNAQDHRSLRQLQFPGGGLRQFGSRDNATEAAKAVANRVRRHANPNNGVNLTRAQFAAYYKFSVVRNPWARAYSWYSNVLRDERHRQRLGVSSDVSLCEFLHKCAATDLLRSQLWWLVDFSGRVRLDRLCRFENLAHDFQAVCAEAGLPDIALPHVLGSGSTSYLDAFDDRSIDLVSRVYAAEIDEFGYAFAT